jgi:hypothetical protein
MPPPLTVEALVACLGLKDESYKEKIVDFKALISGQKLDDDVMTRVCQAVQQQGDRVSSTVSSVPSLLSFSPLPILCLLLQIVQWEELRLQDRLAYEALTVSLPSRPRFFFSSPLADSLLNCSLRSDRDGPSPSSSHR